MLLGALTGPLMFGSLCCTHCSTVNIQSGLLSPLGMCAACVCECSHYLNPQERNTDFWPSHGKMVTEFK